MGQLSHSQNLTLHKLKLFLALSRTPHGLLDLATPGLAALLCLEAAVEAVVVVVNLGLR